MIKDKYFVQRGGTANIIDVSCASCKKLILTYQKDGPGWLKRCYLNRIIGPQKYAKLQNDKAIKNSDNLSHLVCSCGNILGIPIQYKDGRLAFQLVRGTFKRVNHKDKVKTSPY